MSDQEGAAISAAGSLAATNRCRPKTQNAVALTWTVKLVSRNLRGDAVMGVGELWSLSCLACLASIWRMGLSVLKQRVSREGVYLLLVEDASNALKDWG